MLGLCLPTIIKNEKCEVYKVFLVLRGLDCLVLRGLDCLVLRGLDCLVLRGLDCLVLRGLDCLVLRGVHKKCGYLLTYLTVR